jgi:hypothetical protein
MTEINAGDDRLRMTVARRDDSITLALQDLATGKTWGPSLLLAVEVHDRTLQRVERLDRYRVDAVEPVDGGVHVTVGDAYRKVSVGLWARIRNGELEVLIPPTEVYDRDPTRCRVFAVDVLPDLLTVGADGVLVLPVGAGALCRPRNKPKLADRFLIYLEQDRWEICSMLPAAAAHDSRGGLALLALEGDCDTECRVATDGKGNGTVGFAATLRRHWPDSVDFAHRRYVYCPIAPADDPVRVTGKRLRRHVREALGKPTLKERAAECPQVAFMLESISLKAWHGMENEGAEMARRDKSNPVTYQSAMTFDETKVQLQRLIKAGIDKMHIYVNGYQPRGHDGLYPTRFPIDERPGGEAKFRELIRFGKELGCHMSVHDDFMMNVPHSPDFDRDGVIHDIYGEMLPSGWWGGGVEYQTWGLALPPEKLEGHLERMRGLGLNGLYYCDYMIRPLEVNYHPKWRGPRSHSAKGQVRIVEAARRAFGGVGIEFGSFPGAVAADWVLATQGRPLKPGWPLTELTDERVPLWSYVFQGLAIQGCCGPTWDETMRAVLLGQHLGSGFSVRDVKGGVLTDERLAALAAAYQVGVKRFGYLQREELMEYAEPAEKVARSVFADGTTVVADFNAGRLEVNGNEVKRPAGLGGE